MESSYHHSYASQHAGFHSGLNASNALPRLNAGASDKNQALQELRKYLKPEYIEQIDGGHLHDYAEVMASVFGKMAFTAAMPNIDCKSKAEEPEIRERYRNAALRESFGAQEEPSVREWQTGMRRTKKEMDLHSLFEAEQETQRSDKPQFGRPRLPRVNAVLDLPSLCREENESGASSLKQKHAQSKELRKEQSKEQSKAWHQERTHKHEESCRDRADRQGLSLLKRFPHLPSLSIIDSSGSESSDGESVGKVQPLVRPLQENPISPLFLNNLYLTHFYTLLHRETAARMDIDWSDPQTQENLTAVSRMLRDALVCREATIRPGGINPGHCVTGSQDFSVVWNAAGKLADRLGIPHAQCPAFFLNFFIEANVCEAMAGELNADLGNPLLAFAFDVENNYAEGMANGWLHGLRLLERLEAKQPLQAEDLEALCAAATRGVRLNTDAGHAEMGCASVSFSISSAHGLTEAGLQEWRADYARLNRYCDEVIAELDLPAKSQELLTLTAPARQDEAGTWVSMCRNRIYPPHMEASQKAVVKGVANRLLKDYRQAVAQANERAGEPGFDVAHAKKLAIVTLCQSLERLHPFSDGNGRMFEFLLPNILLLSEGLEAYAPVRPYKCDAASRLEMLEEMRAGQEKVKGMREAAVTAQPHASVGMAEAALRKMLNR